VSGGNVIEKAIEMASIEGKKAFCVLKADDSMINKIGFVCQSQSWQTREGMPISQASS
jgi:hypothetical protein